MRSLIAITDHLVTAPTLEPLDLDEIKKALKWTTTSEDTLLDLWTSAARQRFEEYTGWQLMTATWQASMACFPSGTEIEVPHPPLQSVTSLVYDDADGVETTIDPSTYIVIAPSHLTARRGRIVLPYGSSWPTPILQPEAVRITYVAGFGSTPGAVPELVRAALIFLVGYFHKYRAEVFETQPGQSLAQVPMGAEAIMRSFKYNARPQVKMLTSWV